ncbi:unnamed protein product [Darwinula stevensoni]|uniref:Poly [ADP-ribose] polymerase n=1 Tax=Darwinula stevensoni TaxID=69355 RepID=A0A7R9AE92_9CRUS|nr:unnamed protein product [Darwinula stevensoni]CAG0902135.1 unnamed protein product [Darwinula stevensoni]
MPPKRKASKVSTSQDEVDLKSLKVADLKSLKVADLKKMCETNGLGKTGTKTQLIQRLQKHQQDEEEPPAKMKKEESEGTKMKKAFQALKEENPTAKRKAKVDQSCPLSNDSDVQVLKDYDSMLNQTNIGQNNNKYYVIQVLHNKRTGNYWTWNRWGRVGEAGQTSLTPCAKDEKKAIDLFKKKFSDKTKNKWENQNNFTPYPGKYTLLDMSGEDEEEEKVEVKEEKGKKKKVKGCSLDKATQELISLIFDHDMFNNAMKAMNLDTKKMPLGKLSKQQIAKGFDALLELEEAIKNKKSQDVLSDLSSKFYTLIPHDFGRMRPTVLDNADLIREKKDMLLVLSDIELAQSMEKDSTKKEGEKKEMPHPLDVKYEQLKCRLTRLDPSHEMYEILQTYKEKTKPDNTKLRILDIFEINREPEGLRAKRHDGISNRKLLWHGTNVAVVAAILKEGLRIMPHSGGLVGKGIYFASLNQKSYGYVGSTGGWGANKENIGIMFLAEVILGNEHSVFQCEPNITKAPAGCDSVVAQGQIEPNPKEDKVIVLDGKQVMVPQGKPVKNPKAKNTSFYFSEYLVYQESQVRLRYLIKFDWSN